MKPALSIEKLSIRQKLGQSFNAKGIALFGYVALRKPELSVPHLVVPGVTHINWAALRNAGFQGCVFDKDNTLTAPYATVMDNETGRCLEQCKASFDGRVVLLSNSAGLRQFDPDGTKAAELEQALGLPVLRHSSKKPGGSATDLETHFRCSASQLVMIGDRLLTDIVFGNRHGMMTILTHPIVNRGEPLAVQLARKVESLLAAQCKNKNIQAPNHGLLADHPLASFSISTSDRH
eukprot:jgi/Botrbrau1/19839/Bobra.0124s0076.2